MDQPTRFEHLEPEYTSLAHRQLIPAGYVFCIAHLPEGKKLWSIATYDETAQERDDRMVHFRQITTGVTLAAVDLLDLVKNEQAVISRPAAAFDFADIAKRARLSW